MFLDKDLDYIKKKGISLESIHAQLDSYNKGIGFVNLQSAVTPENGIYVPGKDEFNFYNGYFTENILNYRFTRFIPASGAASRMFKALFEALEKLKDEKTDFKHFVNSNIEMAGFFNGIKSYPFSGDLSKFIPDLQISDRKSAYTLLKYILESPGLNYGFLPKGLLKFHSYKDGARTAFEEHFIEASHYLVNDENKIFLHFTVSPEHRILFETLSGELASKFRLKQAVDFIVSFFPTEKLLQILLQLTPTIPHSELIQANFFSAPAGMEPYLKILMILMKKLYLLEISIISHPTGLKV